MIHAQKYSLLFLFLVLVACFDKKRPNIKLLNKDLGISIPKHSLAQARVDPFGVGLDDREEYTLQFDSANFSLLETQIAHSFLFNVASKNVFDRLPLRQKIELLRRLSERQLTAYWVKSGDTYLFDADSTLHNPSDNVYQYLPAKHIFFPNEDSTRVSNGFSMTVYDVKAIVDSRKRTLYFQYTHI